MIQGGASRLVLAGLAAISVHAAQASTERIIRISDQSIITKTQFIKVLLQADVVLLGELHDNEIHHQRRAEVALELTRPGLTFFAEHLRLGQRAEWSAGLLPGLEQAGFDTQAWAWPIHQVLFDALSRTGQPLWGANLAPAEVRQAAATQGVSLPGPLRALLAQAPLSPKDEETLQSLLMDSHCAMMPAAMMPAMVWAQRARDAAMASAMLGASPAILFAGNGHVRTDFGVPQIIRSLRPDLNLVSVMWLEQAPRADEPAVFADYVWVTAPAPRADPCDRLRRK
jgi:uncharacterized iron-regulated protein